MPPAPRTPSMRYGPSSDPATSWSMVRYGPLHHHRDFEHGRKRDRFWRLPMARVPASEFQREFGRFRGVAHREAVIVTTHGRDAVVLLSAEEYRRLRSLDRRAIHVSELTDEELAALDAVEIPAEAMRYNHEM